MNLCTKQKQTQRYREQICDCQGVGGWERNGLGVWDQQMQATANKISTYKQQDPTVQHMELYSIFISFPIMFYPA